MDVASLEPYKPAGRPLGAKSHRAVRDAFPDAAIYPLARMRSNNRVQEFLEWGLMLAFDTPYGLFGLSDSLSNRDAYYLVEEKNRHVLARVTPQAVEGKDGAKLIWVDTDGYESTEYGKVMLTSVIKEMDQAVFDAVQQGATGKFDNKPYVGTLENEGVGLAPYHDLDAEVPDDLEVLDDGVWRWSRHPNYFGDSCVWWGIYLCAAGVWPATLTLLSPIAMTYFLVYATGARLRRLLQLKRA